jgi:hypothetical protein
MNKMTEEKTRRKSSSLPKEVIRDIRGIAEEKLTDLRGKLRKYEQIDDTNMLALGIAFLIGLAFGIAITKKRE